MTFTLDIALELRLAQRITLQECQMVAYNLKKATPSLAPYFQSDLFNDSLQFFKICDARALTISQVANAIDSMGKLTIADELRRKVVRFDENKVLAQVDKRVLTDDEFRRYCTALGLGPSVHMRLSHDHVSRNYLAIREWTNMAVRTHQDFVDCMAKYSPLLATELGAASSGNVRNQVVDTTQAALDSFHTTGWTSTSQPPTTNLLADLFDQTTKIETIRSFVNGPRNGYLIDVCLAMDKKKEWKQLLKNLGLFTDKRIVDLSNKLESEYNKTRAETTLPLLQEIAKGKFGDKSLDEFETELVKLDSPMVKEAVKDWITSRMEKQVNEQKVNETVVESHNEISKFLSNNDLVSEGAIPEIAQRLADFGATDLPSLKELQASDFEDAGLNRVKARKAEKLLAELKC